MRFFLLMVVYGIVALVLESTWFAHLPTDVLFRFDLIIIAVAALAFYHGWKRALPVLLFYGLMNDVISTAPFGMATLSYLAIYGMIRMIVAKISFQGGMALIFWVAMISLMNRLVSSVVLLAVSGKVVFPEIFIENAPLQALFDALLAVLLIPFIHWYSDLTWEKISKPDGLVLK